MHHPTHTTIIRTLSRNLGALGVTLITATAAVPPTQPVVSADIIIYGGTSSGVMAAVQARRLGKSVVLIEPGRNVGGMAASGLGATDIGNRDVIGGLAREFYRRAYDYYLAQEAWTHESREYYAPKHRDSLYEAQKMQFFMEPHVAEKLFNEFLRQHDVRVFFGERLDRTPLAGTAKRMAGVHKDGNRIASIRMESGRVFAGKVFIDASYEGDLLAGAGVSYMLGREPNRQFGETLNGVRPPDVTKIDPYVRHGVPESGLLPGIASTPPGLPGTGDRRVQAYTFRVCLTDVPENRLTIERPENYDAALYELLAREFEVKPDHFPGHSLFKLTPLPNRKTDSNNLGLFSTNFVGQSYDWTEASYARREEMWRAHRDYILGFFWFLGNDERVPHAVREEVRRWGLPKDEFQNNDYWPWQLYVREARRLLGSYVITERDCVGWGEADDPVGMGSYHMDSHLVSRYVDKHGKLCSEGFFFRSVDPFGISYRALTPREEECVNLLVSVCVSASHVAYGSARMEPVFMVLGQSAATAAAQSVDSGKAVQDLDYAELRQRLLQDGQILEFSSPAKQRRLEEAAAVAAAVNVLFDRGIIASKQYWLANTKGGACDGELVGKMLINAAKRGKTITSLPSALEILEETGKIANVDYWRVHAVTGKQCSGHHVAKLLVDLAKME